MEKRRKRRRWKRTQRRKEQQQRKMRECWTWRMAKRTDHPNQRLTVVTKRLVAEDVVETVKRKTDDILEL